MEQKVNSQSPRRVHWRTARWVLGAATLGTGINLALFWLDIPFRLYLSAAAWYYVNLLAGFPWVGTVLGIGTVLALLLWARRPGAALWLFGWDTGILLVFALFFLKNPICCVPELLCHGAVLWAAYAAGSSNQPARRG